MTDRVLLMSEENTDNIPTPQHVLITAEQVAEKVDELGKQISQDYSKEAPLLVGVLKGAFVFMSDLSRGIGDEVLLGLQQLNVGMATEAGIAIVLLAIIFDRITQSYGEKIQERTQPKKNINL